MTYSVPTNPGSTGHGLSWKYVRVRQLFPDRRTALVVDQFGKGMEISYMIMGAKGLRPDPGEDWVVEHRYGRWVFSAILTGPDGVAVEQIDGLSDVLDETSDSITALDARLDKNEVGAKHLWTNVAPTVSIPANLAATIGSFTQVTNAGIATFTGGVLKLNRQGRWSLNLQVEGGPVVDGLLIADLQFGTPSPATPANGALSRSALGLAAFGYVATGVTWTGWVTQTQADTGFAGLITWVPTTGTDPLAATWMLGLEYLGPF